MRRIPLSILIAALASLALGQEFEVVSVKPNKSLSGSSSVHSDRGRISATNVSLRSLIMRAYGLKDFQIDGPDWLGSEHFDVAAKFPEALPKEGEAYNAGLRVMMQNMLKDRFNLAVHREQKTFSVYALTVGKGGIKFKEVPNNDSHSESSGNTRYTGKCVSMDAFSGFLSRQKDLPVDLPVLDMTGLKGCYNVTLEWVREQPDNPSSGPTLVLALEDQLGLKLETRKAPVEVLVVDHAEKLPSDN